MKIRYKIIKKIVDTLFLDLNIASYPINIKDLYVKCRKNNYKNFKAISYTEHMGKYNLTDKEVISWFGSEEGCTDYHPIKKRYLVYYNDLNNHYKSPERIRWTLAHELGHILLDHHNLSNKTRLFRNTLNDDEYKWMESEANYFSSLLLANPIILDKLNIQDEFDVSEICYLSKEASVYRFQGYLNWCRYKYIDFVDKKILANFHDFIHKKYCSKCAHAFISEIAKYCPICGHNRLIRGDGKMIYESLNIDNDSKFLICPDCDNEEIDVNALYCKICGKVIKNQCASLECKELAKGNARHCIHCGSETTFFQKNLLKNWETEWSENTYEKFSEELNPMVPVDDGDIPF